MTATSWGSVLIARQQQQQRHGDIDNQFSPGPQLSIADFVHVSQGLATKGVRVSSRGHRHPCTCMPALPHLPLLSPLPLPRSDHPSDVWDPGAGLTPSTAGMPALHIPPPPPGRPPSLLRSDQLEGLPLGMREPGAGVIAIHPSIASLADACLPACPSPLTPLPRSDHPSGVWDPGVGIIAINPSIASVAHASLPPSPPVSLSV